MAYLIFEYFSENTFLSLIIEQNKELTTEYGLPNLLILEETSNLFLFFQKVIKMMIVESSLAQKPEDVVLIPTLMKSTCSLSPCDGICHYISMSL